MSNLVICTACDLKHVRRPELACPRCGGSVVAAAGAGGSRSKNTRRGDHDSIRGDLSSEGRYAGFLFIVDSALSLFAMFAVDLPGNHSPPMAVLFGAEMLLGLLLLCGLSKAVFPALVWLLVHFVALMATTGGVASTEAMVAVLVISLAWAGLLVGKPGSALATLCGLVATVLIGLTAYGLYQVVMS